VDRELTSQRRDSIVVLISQSGRLPCLTQGACSPVVAISGVVDEEIDHALRTAGPGIVGPTSTNSLPATKRSSAGIAANLAAGPQLEKRDKGGRKRDRSKHEQVVERPIPECRSLGEPAGDALVQLQPLQTCLPVSCRR